jgi:hypothetical protein
VETDMNKCGITVTLLLYDGMLKRRGYLLSCHIFYHKPKHLAPWGHTAVTQNTLGEEKKTYTLLKE